MLCAQFSFLEVYFSLNFADAYLERTGQGEQDQNYQVLNFF